MDHQKAQRGPVAFEGEEEAQVDDQEAEVDALSLSSHCGAGD